MALSLLPGWDRQMDSGSESSGVSTVTLLSGSLSGSSQVPLRWLINMKQWFQVPAAAAALDPGATGSSLVPVSLVPGGHHFLLGFILILWLFCVSYRERSRMTFDL